jgi:hypothetical protein
MPTTKAVNFSSFLDIKPYIFEGRRHMYYEDSEKKRKQFLPHSDGAYPQEIIERQRPNESDRVKEFRKEIWEPITLPKFTQIVSSLGKIRRSSDWSIKYDIAEDKIARIAEGETLEDYCEVNFPFFGSITNWVFGVLIKPYLIDPNAVVLVMPLELDIQQTEFLRPYPYLFECVDVLDFVPEQYAILNDPEGSTQYRDGKSIYVVTMERIQRWEQVSAKNFTITFEYEHGMGMLPAFKLGGLISKSHGRNFLFESRIKGVLPNLNEAIAEYTDLQAGKRLHIYPERWEYTQHECGPCKGSGQVRNPAYEPGGTMSNSVNCRACDGLGYVASTGPYSKIIIKPPQAGAQPLPNPPAGFIEKDVEIIKIMDESVRRHIYDALAAINFQFLDQSPLNQSGVAKEVDKEELNNTVHAIAEDIVRIMDQIYLRVAYYRYRLLYNNNVEQIQEMLPSIAVPDHFDLLSSQFMQEEIGKAKAAKLNPTIVSAMELEYSGKRFINEPEVKDRLSLVLKLDPLPNVTEDEKMSMLSNKGITQLNYVISSNIQAFVQRAINEDAGFAEQDIEDQVAKMEQYATEQIDAQKAESDAEMKKQQQLLSGTSINDGNAGRLGVEDDEPEPELEPVV